jgi:hypothetical protein
MILLTEAPAISMAKESKRLPAGYRPKIYGWLLHLNASTPQASQCWTTVTMVPFWYMSTLGFSFLHVKQNKENRDNSML